MEKTTKTNLFTSAKKVDTPKETKSKLQSLPVPSELEEHLQTYEEAKKQVKHWEGKMTMAEGVIKDKARDLFLAEYKTHKRNIGSFKLVNITIIVQDRYSKMEDPIAEIVAQNFPDVLETNTEYLFNQTILQKYINPISDALQNAVGIPEEELALLIEAKQITTVKKGTIDTLANYGEKMSDLFQAIKPIISMR